ncbi:MAG TPA: sigma-70 family RNA polymerase sigma factor [Polyangiaceae bacterium]|nr:sigma-70 family RNA polymerase sigma factor [Polyangiaceae bacterium]
MSEPEHRERKTRSGPSSGSFKVARVEVQELAALSGPDGFTAPGGDLLSDELLVDRVLAGEPEHFNVLMRRTAARLYRITRGISGNTLRAEDLVRDAFVRAYENLAGYDRRLRFADWLARIAIHGALGSVKRDSSPPQPLRRQQRELVRQLEDAVDDLPERFRVAVTLCVLDDMMPRDVAQTLGITEDAVRTAAFRGRLRLRRQIGMRFDDAEPRAFGLDLASANEIMGKVRVRLGLG